MFYGVIEYANVPRKGDMVRINQLISWLIDNIETNEHRIKIFSLTFQP